MERTEMDRINPTEVLNGFKNKGIGLHGTYSGNVARITAEGIKTPAEQGLPTRDNYVCYYSTPSKAMLEVMQRKYPDEDTLIIVMQALRDSVGISLGGYALSGDNAESKKLRWETWEQTPDLLPALIFFASAETVRPINEQTNYCARGVYEFGKLFFPEIRSKTSIEPSAIIGSVTITPDQVALLEQGLDLNTSSGQVALNRKVREQLTNTALNYLIQVLMKKE